MLCNSSSALHCGIPAAVRDVQERVPNLSSPPRNSLGTWAAGSGHWSRVPSSLSTISSDTASSSAARLFPASHVGLWVGTGSPFLPAHLLLPQLSMRTWPCVGSAGQHVQWAALVGFPRCPIHPRHAVEICIPWADYCLSLGEEIELRLRKNFY